MPKIVLATCIDGRNAQGWNACDAEEGYCEKGTAGIEDRPNVFFARTQGRAPESLCTTAKLDTFELPGTLDEKLIVMPLLRPFDSPRYQTYGEFVAFFAQISKVSLHVT